MPKYVQGRQAYDWVLSTNCCTEAERDSILDFAKAYGRRTTLQIDRTASGTYAVVAHVHMMKRRRRTWLNNKLKGACRVEKNREHNVRIEAERSKDNKADHTLKAVIKAQGAIEAKLFARRVQRKAIASLDNLVLHCINLQQGKIPDKMTISTATPTVSTITATQAEPEQTLETEEPASSPDGAFKL